MDFQKTLEQIKNGDYSSEKELLAYVRSNPFSFDASVALLRIYSDNFHNETPEGMKVYREICFFGYLPFLKEEPDFRSFWLNRERKNGEKALAAVLDDEVTNENANFLLCCFPDFPFGFILLIRSYSFRYSRFCAREFIGNEYRNPYRDIPWEKIETLDYAVQKCLSRFSLDEIGHLAKTYPDSKVLSSFYSYLSNYVSYWKKVEQEVQSLEMAVAETITESHWPNGNLKTVSLKSPDKVRRWALLEKDNDSVLLLGPLEQDCSGFFDVRLESIAGEGMTLRKEKHHQFGYRNHWLFAKENSFYATSNLPCEQLLDCYFGQYKDALLFVNGKEKIRGVSLEDVLKYFPSPKYVCQMTKKYTSSFCVDEVSPKQLFPISLDEHGKLLGYAEEASAFLYENLLERTPKDYINWKSRLFIVRLDLAKCKDFIVSSKNEENCL